MNPCAGSFFFDNVVLIFDAECEFVFSGTEQTIRTHDFLDFVRDENSKLFLYNSK